MALINFRNALMTGKRTPTAKDYVQSGLIAMWDGIENAGWGTHDASATTWKDLIGSGYDFQIPTTGVEFKDDCVSKAWGVSLSTLLPEVSRQEFSIEIVANIKRSESGAGIIWAANPSWRGGALFYRTGMVFQFYYPWAVLTSVDYVDNIGVIKSWSINWKPSAQNLFCDNSVIASMQQRIDSRNVLSRWSLGEYDNNKQSEVDYYSVRLYSRALTAAEISANYAIDKARFGLP